MSGYTLANFNFVRWEGPRPQFQKQHVREFAKAGKDGLTAQRLGTYGDPFTVRLTAVFPDSATAADTERQYPKLIGNSPSMLFYEGVNYALVYGVRYFVHDVTTEMLKRRALLIGPGYNYPGGYQVITQFVLIPTYTGT